MQIDKDLRIGDLDADEDTWEIGDKLYSVGNKLNFNRIRVISKDLGEKTHLVD